MRRIRTSWIGLILPLALLACGADAGQPDVKPETAPLAPTGLTTFEQKASYAIGMDIGRNLKNTPMDIDLEVLFDAIRTIFQEGEPQLTQEQAMEVMNEFRTKMQEEQKKQREEDMKKNKAEGDAFLEKNKTRAGVVTTDSGLQYEVLTEGDGPKPTASSKVKVHYKGTLLDGTEFDSSYSRGQPATFQVDRVVKGWTEALQMMSVGSKYKLYIPPELGYGERGAGAKIGPNATLVFEVELLSIEE